MFFQHVCTVYRPSKQTIKHTEKTVLTSIASDVKCTLWSPRGRGGDSGLSRTTNKEEKQFMTAYAVEEGDVVDVVGFGKYVLGTPDKNQSLRTGTVDNLYAVATKYGDS